MIAFSKFSRATSGLTLFEVLTVVTILGIAAALAIPRVSGLRSSATETKLRSDVAVLNSAVKTYLANGGVIQPTDGAEEILVKLKTPVSDEQASTFVGMTGSLIDERIQPRWLPKGRRDASVERAFWNGVSGRFEITTAPMAGIAMFTLGEAPKSNGTEGNPGDDRSSVMNYASNSNWIWDYVEESPDTAPGASDIAVSTVDDDSAPPARPSPPPSSSGPGTLAPPLFSRAPGTYAIDEYALEVTLSDPNATGASVVYYQRSGGDWTPYAPGTVFSLKPDEQIRAFAHSTDRDKYTSSSVSQAVYEASPAPLRLDIDSESRTVSYYDLVDGDSGADLLVTNVAEFPPFVSRPGFFSIWWATDDADPTSGEGTLLGEYGDDYAGHRVSLDPSLWSTQPTLTLKGWAQSREEKWALSSEVTEISLTARPESLPSPKIDIQEQSNDSQLVSLSIDGRHPPGSRIYFNTSGDPPSLDPETGAVRNGQPYTGPFLLDLDFEEPENPETGGETVEIGNGINDVAISQVVLKSEGKRLEQNESYYFDQLDDPSFDGASNNEVVDNSNKRITLESITIQQGDESIVADHVNVLQVSVSNLNIPDRARDGDVRVKRSGKVVSDLGDREENGGGRSKFAQEVEKTLRSKNLRDYIDYSSGSRSRMDSDHDFDVSFSPLTNDDFLVVMERYGNSTFDLRPLDATGKPIPGGNRLAFRAYSWNTGHAPSDQGQQAMFFSVIDIEKFGVNTNFQSIAGFRVNNDGGADFKFFTISSDSFEDREVRYTGGVQARVFPPEGLEIWFDPSAPASASVEGTATR